MANPIEFGLALSNSHPSGTGSYTYEGTFKLVVQNLAFEKQVAIRSQVGSLWKEIAASYVHALPDNRELWNAPASNNEGKFVARYTVNGTTYWDNNGGANYDFPQAFDQFAVVTGNNYKIVLGDAALAGGALHVNLGIQNLAFNKIVGIVFTPDNWATVQTASGYYSSTMKGGLEVWNVTAAVGSASEVQFAAFYQVLGNEYWDNNFARNYKVTAGSPQQWGAP